MDNRKTLLKVVLIIVMILIFIVPITIIENLLNERVDYKNVAIKEISSKWGNSQTIAGPVLTIPYSIDVSAGNYVGSKVIKYAHFLPDDLQIEVELFPEIRYRGIYEVVVYNSKLKIKGNFKKFNIDEINLLKGQILLNQAFIALGISDLRGIEEQLKLKFNDSSYGFYSGINSKEVISSGVSTSLPLTQEVINSNNEFEIDLVLKGSQALNFIPVGKTTTVDMKSIWDTPSFSGAFLPDNRNIDDKGFDANWKILHLNRNYPQHWTNTDYNIYESAFGVTLQMPVDNYKKTERAVKYSFLIIILTFVLLFFIEIINSVNLHPFQYLLIGFALCIFYILLLSLSEHISFDFAYLIAGTACIGLITLYSKFIINLPKIYLFIFSTLIILYGFIFTILQLEDFALLMGSIGLFLILTVIMYASRKIDWYNFKLMK